MKSYNFIQWLLFFYIYGFIGWIIESTIVSIENKKFVNRGFLKMPMLPLYGFGAIIMLFAGLPFKSNPFLSFITAAVCATILEYLTGVIMEALFKVKYWDYSTESYNFQGRICVVATLFWGFLSLFLTYNLHEWVDNLVMRLSDHTIIIIDIIVSIVFVTDVITSVKAAIDIKKILAKLTSTKLEIEKIISQKLDNPEYALQRKNAIAKLKAERQKLINKMNFMNKSLLKSHPRATSSRFAEALKELKDSLQNKRLLK